MGVGKMPRASKTKAAGTAAGPIKAVPEASKTQSGRLPNASKRVRKGVPWPALGAKYRPIEDLIPFARNARTHSDDQVSQIAASIGGFGFTNPILPDGENGIIAGHGPFAAAKELGLEKIPCIDLSHLTGEQKRAYGHR